MTLAIDRAPGHSVGTGNVAPRRRSGRPRRLALAAAAIAGLAAPASLAGPAVPQGVWLIDSRAAVQIYDCEGLMCGRIVWLKTPRNDEGQLDRDKNNPDLSLRRRELCGLTILRNLHPVGPDRWRDGWFYNPDDGLTYRVTAHLQSDDVIVARIFLLVPILGKTKTLVRVPLETTDGWC